MEVPIKTDYPENIESRLREDGKIIVAEPVPCPYLEGQFFTQEYFFTDSLDSTEFGQLLDTGWRHFGFFFFRPACKNCRACRPIRIRCNDFKPSKSQRRLVKKNSKIEFSIIEVGDFFETPQPNEKDENGEDNETVKEDEIKKRWAKNGFDPLTLLQRSFDIYKKHSLVKFKQEAEIQSFLESFYTPTVESYQSIYTIDKKIVGVGYLDLGQNGLSSVYFSYDPDYSRLGLGGYSVIREIQWTIKKGLPYYYLGYYIPECSRMAYKGKYLPYEIYNWESGIWENQQNNHTLPKKDDELSK